jgi:DNA polymerase-1
VNAVYGFTSILLNVLQQLEPTHLAASFDIGETFRHKEYKEYKAHREKMPEELKEQESRTYEVLEALNIPVYTKENYEADDVIGTLAKQVTSYKLQGTSDKITTMIVTGDKDVLQLVSDVGRVRVYMPGRGIKGPVTYDEAKVVEDMGISAAQIPDFKGLAGDSSDNIPGVHGIGKVTAVKLLQQFGSVEEIYEHLDRLKGAVLQKLQTGKDSAFESKHLATIVREVPIKLNLDACEVKHYDKARAVALFEDLEFQSLMRKLPGDSFEESVQESLF